ncbi:inorganic phosphate transporter [Rhodovulum strictum]|uniref:Phosphate transporter n=1 Tax=Rhodovulum strictum TaxID=58314 RepID=A0A844B3K4_9RHOB|nr:inorganic phosphate transporter [Rhodovulum strictum]MRH20721.1 inorganic phosphate transporter [Rhodovulum strictum]
MPTDTGFPASAAKDADLRLTAPAGWRGTTGRLAIAGAFLICAAVYAATGSGENALLLALAAGFGGYMALNIGANDVANNIGPTVGARVMPIGAALVMAALCEAAGAIIAGGEVVGTIRSGIIDPALIPSTQAYVWAMLAALLAGAVWLNLATAVGAPVSTTHSIVGGVLGAGIAAAGPAVVNWGVMGNIAASWVVSPMIGAALAALCLYLVKRGITYQPDLRAAAYRGVPLLAAAMAWAFTVYLLLKGLSKIVDVTTSMAVLGGLIVALAVWGLMRGHVARRLTRIENSKDGVNRLLGIPLILAAGALSFAHGSNDVANAIGPLAGIVDALGTGEFHGRAAIPLWVLVLGAIGLLIGLLTYGPRVIRTIGDELTDLDPIRAWCIAMSATMTVILASQLGLPISTTHVTVGAVLGVGFLREKLKTRHAAIIAEIRAHHPQGDSAAAEQFIARFHATPFGARKAMLADLKARNRAGVPAPLDREDRKVLDRAHRRDLVNRSLMLRIFAAWIVTVPATAVLSALIYYTLRGILMP